MIQLNYHHLYYFKVIATEGSISKAAEKLLLGQPTISMQLKQFEDFLGQPLFERKNRSLVLTEMGKVVLSYATEIFRLGDELLDAIHDRPSPKRLKLQIGALDSVPKALIRDLMIKAFKTGDCQVAVHEGEGPELMHELVQHRLDLVVSNSSAPSLTEDKLYAKSLAKMQLCVVASPKFAHLKEKFPHSLQAQPFIFPTAHSRVRHEIEHFLENRLLQVNVIAETMDTSLMKTLAVAGQGLIVVSEPAVRPFIKKGSLIILGDLDEHFEEIWLIAAQRKLQNPIAKELMSDFTFEADLAAD